MNLVIRTRAQRRQFTELIFGGVGETDSGTECIMCRLRLPAEHEMHSNCGPRSVVLRDRGYAHK